MTQNARINCLLVIVAVQAVALLAVRATVPWESTAQAQGIPDAGAQRDRIIEQLRTTNERLDKLVTLLSSGELQVRVTKADNDASHR